MCITFWETLLYDVIDNDTLNAFSDAEFPPF